MTEHSHTKHDENKKQSINTESKLLNNKLKVRYEAGMRWITEEEDLGC